MTREELRQIFDNMDYNREVLFRVLSKVLTDE